MSDLDQSIVITTPRLRVMQFVIGALAAGVVSFMILAVVMREAGVQQPAGKPLTDVLGYVGIAMAIVCCIVSYVLPSAMVATWRRQQAPALLRQTTGHPDGPAAVISALLGVYQTSSIAGAAPLEGAAFFQLIAYMIGAEPYTLGVALGLLVFLLTKMPTRDGVERWVATQQALLEDERTRATS